jgi:molecular chaperone IbpA
MRKYPRSNLIGFEELLNTFFSDFTPQSNYPPYNIIKQDDDSFKIEVAASGFSPDQLDVTVDQDNLVISGKVSEEDNSHFIHRGIAKRNFNLRFLLQKHIEISHAEIKDGLLVVSLKRKIPEELQPRKIMIEHKT